MSDACLGEKRINPEEMCLVTRGKRHRDRVLGNTARGAFATCVDCLSDLRPSGEIISDDDVVTKVGGAMRNLARLGRRCR